MNGVVGLPHRIKAVDDPAAVRIAIGLGGRVSDCNKYFIFSSSLIGREFERQYKLEKAK